MIEVLARLSGLTKPDREIDRVILRDFVKVGSLPDDLNAPGQVLTWPNGTPIKDTRFTESLDACISLLENMFPGPHFYWKVVMRTAGFIPASAEVNDAVFQGVYPAAALLGAVIRAVEFEYEKRWRL